MQGEDDTDNAWTKRSQAWPRRSITVSAGPSEQTPDNNLCLVEQCAELAFERIKLHHYKIIGQASPDRGRIFQDGVY